MKKLVCEKCGGENIQKLAMVDANTNEYIEDIDNSGLVFCDDCGEEVEPKTIEI